MRIAVIGGGAAGFFGAITAAESLPDADVFIFEKSDKLLSKVKISGGGRCNITNASFDVAEFVKNYPRGNKELISVFKRFGSKDIMDWFESRGVKLKTESDNRVFPLTDDSQTIIYCLINETQKLNIKIKKEYSLNNLIIKDNEFRLNFKNGEIFDCDKIMIAIGGISKPDAFEWIEKTGHTIIKPVPSLFTFILLQDIFSGLEGISVADVQIKLIDDKPISQRGSILITHGGLSGFGVLKFSAFAARILFERNYKFSISINWLPGFRREYLLNELLNLKNKILNKTLGTTSCFKLPLRLWKRLIQLSGIEPEKKLIEISNQKINNFVNILTEQKIEINGKNTNKEEFVTAGGISLKEVNFKTMESKICPGIYFAGEVLDIDGVTGGFNFQSAWSTAYIAGKSIANLK